MPRFLSPLIKPVMRISRIRLSDWFHLTAHGGDTELVRAAEAAGDGKRAQQHQISGRLRRRVKPLQKRPDAQGVFQAAANHRSSASSKAHQK